MSEKGKLSSLPWKILKCLIKGKKNITNGKKGKKEKKEKSHSESLRESLGNLAKISRAEDLCIMDGDEEK